MAVPGWRWQKRIVRKGTCMTEFRRGMTAKGGDTAEYASKPEMTLSTGQRGCAVAKSGILFVAADQGTGDTLSFARFVPLAAKRVTHLILQVQPEILNLLTDAFASIGNIQVVPLSLEMPHADAWCPIMSLPTALGLTTEEIRDAPQSWTVPFSVTRFDDKPQWMSPAANLHVAISFAGAAANDIDRWRSIPVTHFLELARVPGVQLYSVQVGDRVQDLHAAGAAGLIRDMSPWIKDARDTVKILAEMDLVISCESFVAHLAGAMGVHCWVPLSRNGGDWRCGRRGLAPIWYEATQLFRQGPDASWPPVFDRIVAELMAMQDRIDLETRES